MASKSTFNLPFKEASAFFQAKLNIPTDRWDDLWQQEHAKGFMAAGAMKADLLTDFRSAVQKAIDGGLTKKEFQAQFDTIVAKHGWAYNGGRNWRSSLIYDTNVTTAYQSGRWQQFIEGGATHLMYLHADGVRNPRPLHLAWDGTVLPIGDPFWKTHYPPNGWGCHCRAVRADAHEETAAPAGYDQLDEKTGAPKGIDKGWAYNVGQAEMKWNPDLDKYDFPIARGMVTELTKSRVFQWWHDFTRERVAAELAKPEFVGMSPAAAIRLLRSRLSTAERFPVAVLTDEIKQMIGANTRGVYLSLDDLIKQQVSRQGQDFEALTYRSAQDSIENARLIVKNTETVTIFVKDGAEGWYAAAVQKTKSGDEVFLKSFRKSSEKDMATQKKKGEVLLER